MTLRMLYDLDLFSTLFDYLIRFSQFNVSDHIDFALLL